MNKNELQQALNLIAHPHCPIPVQAGVQEQKVLLLITHHLPHPLDLELGLVLTTVKHISFNSYGLKLALKEYREGGCLVLKGKEFHSIGAATLKY